MKKKQGITEEQRIDLLKYNRSRIYKNRLPKKYKYLLQTIEPVRSDLLAFLNELMKVEVFRHEGRYAVTMSNNILTVRVRERTTRSTTNKHFSYLVAIGLLIKDTKLTEINKAYLKQQGQESYKRPINQYIIPRYTDDVLEKADARSKRLIEAGITQGNISHDKLTLNGLYDIAKEIYLYNSEEPAQQRIVEWSVINDLMNKLIEQNGYTTKQQIYDDYRLECDTEEIIKLFQIYNQAFKAKYQYKRPSKQEKELFNLTSNKYIILRREQEIGKNGNQ